MLSRYLCQHLLFCTLQHALRHTFTAVQNAPLPLALLQIHSFGTLLESRVFSAHSRLTSELLRTL